VEKGESSREGKGQSFGEEGFTYRASEVEHHHSRDLRLAEKVSLALPDEKKKRCGCFPAKGGETEVRPSFRWERTAPRIRLFQCQFGLKSSENKKKKKGKKRERISGQRENWPDAPEKAYGPQTYKKREHKKKGERKSGTIHMARKASPLK